MQGSFNTTLSSLRFTIVLFPTPTCLPVATPQLSSPATYYLISSSSICTNTLLSIPSQIVNVTLLYICILVSYTMLGTCSCLYLWFDLLLLPSYLHMLLISSSTPVAYVPVSCCPLPARSSMLLFCILPFQSPVPCPCLLSVLSLPVVLTFCLPALP